MNHLLKLFFSRPGILAATLLALLSTAAAAQTQLLHPTNTVWRYQTDLLEQQNAGVAWVNPGFDDSAWPEGKGLFGNDGGYPYAMNTTGTGLANGLPAANYFRTHFTWSGSTAGVVLAGTNYIDDGSIIYLNGVEITRFNMPASANAGTPEASAPVANPGGYPNINGGEPVLVRLEIALDALTNGNANPLVQGDNVIAVQAHQNGTGSSDRVFGLALYAAQCAPPCFSATSPFQPTNRVIFEGRSTIFTAIEQCAVPTPTFQWYRDIGAGEELIPGATAASYTLTNAMPYDTGVYYVKATSTSAFCGGTATSRQAVLLVSGDPSPPKLLSGRLGANNLEIIVTADEPVCPDDSCAGNATLTFNWEVYVEGNPNQQLAIAGITVNGNTLTFTLAPETPWATDTRYVVRLLPFGGGIIGDLYGNLLSGDDPFSSVTTLAMASAISLKGIMGISDLYTFDVPPNQYEFSTFYWTGAAGDAASGAALDTAVQGLSAASINQPLFEATGNPPGASGHARYAVETKNLITRPTGVLGNVIMAHLRNDSGSPAQIVTLNYTLTNREPSAAEEVAGHLVYYSVSGAPQTWMAVFGDLFNNGASGRKSGFIEFRSSRWPAGADLYVLFVDDNASGTIEGIYEIDNFRASIGHIDCFEPIAPVLVRAVSRDSTTIVLTFSEAMAASAGTTAPYSASGATVTGATLSGDAKEVTLTTTVRPVGTSTVTITGITDYDYGWCPVSMISPNPISFRLTTVQKLTGWADAWEYNTNNLDAVPTWKTTGGTGWQTGNALFGTEISAGVVLPVPIATPILPAASNSLTTVYFRKSVTLPALLAGQSYAIGHYTDDGAVFYIDGAEIGRVNMPGGTVTNLTLASAASTEGLTLALPFAATAGDHVLAVEVHQNSNTSSDIVFGASVLVVPTASPSLSIAPMGTNVMVNWNADSSWVLVNSTNVAGPYTEVRGATPPRFTRPVTTPAAQFYKLNYVPQP